MAQSGTGALSSLTPSYKSSRRLAVQSFTGQAVPTSNWMRAALPHASAGTLMHVGRFFLDPETQDVWFFTTFRHCLKNGRRKWYPERESPKGAPNKACRLIYKREAEREKNLKTIGAVDKLCPGLPAATFPGVGFAALAHVAVGSWIRNSANS